MVVPFDYRDQSNRHYRRSLLQAGLAGDNLARVKYAAFRATMLMAEKLMADGILADKSSEFVELFGDAAPDTPKVIGLPSDNRFQVIMPMRIV